MISGGAADKDARSFRDPVSGEGGQIDGDRAGGGLGDRSHIKQLLFRKVMAFFHEKTAHHGDDHITAAEGKGADE